MGGTTRTPTRTLTPMCSWVSGIVITTRPITGAIGCPGIGRTTRIPTPGIMGIPATVGPMAADCRLVATPARGPVAVDQNLAPALGPVSDGAFFRFLHLEVHATDPVLDRLRRGGAARHAPTADRGGRPINRGHRGASPSRPRKLGGAFSPARREPDPVLEPRQRGRPNRRVGNRARQDRHARRPPRGGNRAPLVDDHDPIRGDRASLPPSDHSVLLGRGNRSIGGGAPLRLLWSRVRRMARLRIPP